METIGSPLAKMNSPRPLFARRFVTSWLRKVESTLAFLDCNVEFLSENLNAAVVWHFEVVDTRHDAREIVI